MGAATVKPSTLKLWNGPHHVNAALKKWKNNARRVEEKNSFRFVDNRKNQFTTYQLSMYVYEEEDCFSAKFCWLILTIIRCNKKLVLRLQ